MVKRYWPYVDTTEYSGEPEAELEKTKKELSGGKNRQSGL